MCKEVKYKLIKEYPGSPKKGVIHYWSEGGHCEGWKGTAFYGKYPEFWEKVEEKNYEILAYYQHSYIYKQDHPNWKFVCKQNYPIYSIKRLSDGEVFTIGDIIESKRQYSFTTKEKILEFRINKYDSSCIYIVLDNQNNSAYSTKYTFDCFKKVEQPLFTTEDGVDIYEGDIYYHIKHIFSDYSDLLNPKGLIDIRYNKHVAKKDNILYCSPSFSTKEAAEKWIDENKSKYSKSNINKAIDSLFDPKLKDDKSVFGKTVMEGYRKAFFKELDNE